MRPPSADGVGFAIGNDHDELVAAERQDGAARTGDLG